MYVKQQENYQITAHDRFSAFYTGEKLQQEVNKKSLEHSQNMVLNLDNIQPPTLVFREREEPSSSLKQGNFNT